MIPRCPISSLPFDISSSHQSSSEELEELAAVFSVEAMTVEESNDYIEHLRLCQVCQRLAGEFQGAADLLPDTLAVESTSPDLKQRILSQAAAEMGQMDAPIPTQSDAAKRSWLSRLWPGGLTPVPAAAIAVLLLAVVGLASWNVVLQQDLSGQNAVLLQNQEVLRGIAAGGQVHQVGSTEAAPEAGAVLIQNPDGKGAVLIVVGLERLPAGMEYQVWRIVGPDTAPIGAGTFSVVESGAHVVQISTSFSPTESIGVSVEPAGGSPAPTGDIVLLGEL